MLLLKELKVFFGGFVNILSTVFSETVTHPINIVFNQEVLPGDSIFIKDHKYRQISDGHSDVVFDLFIEHVFLQLIALLSNF